MSSSPSPPCAALCQPKERMLRYTFCIGTLFDVRIHIHYGLPIFTLVYSLLLALYLGGLGFALGIVVYGPMLYLVVYIHEMGHCIAARKLGSPAEDMLIWPLGGLMFHGQPVSVMCDLGVAVAGPATHVPHIILGLIVLAAANKGSVEAGKVPSLKENFFAVVCWEYLFMNILMLFMNFVPAYPLDGSKTLIDSLLLLGMGKDKTAMVTVRISWFLVVVFVVLSMWSFVVGLSFGFITLCCAALLVHSALGLQQYQKDNTLGQHPCFRDIPLRVVTTPTTAVPSSSDSQVSDSSYTVNASATTTATSSGQCHQQRAAKDTATILLMATPGGVNDNYNDSQGFVGSKKKNSFNRFW